MTQPKALIKDENLQFEAESEAQFAMANQWQEMDPSELGEGEEKDLGYLQDVFGQARMRSGDQWEQMTEAELGDEEGVEMPVDEAFALAPLRSRRGAKDEEENPRVLRLNTQIEQYRRRGDEARARRAEETRDALVAAEEAADAEWYDTEDEDALVTDVQQLSLLQDDPSIPIPGDVSVLEYLDHNTRDLVMLWDGEVGANFALSRSPLAMKQEWIALTTTMYSIPLDDLRGAALRGELKFGSPAIAQAMGDMDATDAQPDLYDQLVAYRMRVVLPATTDDLLRFINTALDSYKVTDLISNRPKSVRQRTFMSTTDRKEIREKFPELKELVARKLAEDPMRIFENDWISPVFSDAYRPDYIGLKEDSLAPDAIDSVTGSPGNTDPNTLRAFLFDQETAWTLADVTSGKKAYSATMTRGDRTKGVRETWETMPENLYMKYATAPKFFVHRKVRTPRIQFQFTTLAHPSSTFLRDVVPMYLDAYMRQQWFVLTLNKPKLS